MPLGYICLVLHAHLPFVRHPDRDDYLEERWFFEALTECYLPLLDSLERLEADGVPFRLAISFSPTLMAMMDDPLLRRRYLAYLAGSVELAEKEVTCNKGRPEETVAHFYRHHLRHLFHLYAARCRGDVLGGFHRLAQAGYLELMTCSATHGFLPLYQHQPEAVRVQVDVAVHEFRRRFGHTPRGFWLPECGYYPGVERFLRDAGVQYCFAETHALMNARPRSTHGPYAHGWAPGGLAVFGRDAVSSRQVWSAREGYPGDAAYREFYRDIGFERESEHLGRLAGPNGIRTFSGFKYHRVTGPTDHKDLYDRWAAEQTAIRHAGHFVQARIRQASELTGLLPGGPPPVIVAPYDAELFGHWWFEGPYFLEQVARHAALQDAIRFVTPGEYLDTFPAGQGEIEPAYSSWGYQGYADFWCDGSNHWMYRHLHGAGRRMVQLAGRYSDQASDPGGDKEAVARRLLNQAARELLLAQASDWAFILRTGTASDYASRRFHSHLGRFRRITDAVENGSEIPWSWLEKVEAADNLFPDLSFGLYSPQSPPE